MSKLLFVRNHCKVRPENTKCCIAGPILDTCFPQRPEICVQKCTTCQMLCHQSSFLDHSRFSSSPRRPGKEIEMMYFFLFNSDCSIYFMDVPQCAISVSNRKGGLQAPPARNATIYCIPVRTFRNDFSPEPLPVNLFSKLAFHFFFEEASPPKNFPRGAHLIFFPLSKFPSAKTFPELFS